ncbi:aldo/keto reductase [Breznakiella homolactica]|uniref:Aldo/keto reductase n=1 Tax=Breznakiella homolactica TaxID=2798577 RepID=A0A7T7XLY1_9SPIR|nr:aldo/keto reductase [Breznakiella homolactica]QQO08799.1 aldo/keto reductase [Breznakiella homolactica]
MEYREIGRTGRKAGIIGLGCENLDNKPYDQTADTISAALDRGINHFDVFMPGKEIRENIAKALGSRRKDVYIQGHIGSTDINQQYDISRDMPTVQKYFEDCLRIFGGYIDFGMLFFIDSQDDFDKVFSGGVADYAVKLKEKGDIGHIGFSSHRPDIAAKVVETGIPEIMLFSINLAFDLCPPDKYTLDTLQAGWKTEEFRGLDPERAALYTLCEQKGVGISVMKTLGAGKLISPEHTPFSKPMTVNQCVHYALSRPAVFSVLLGCRTGAEVEDALTYLDAGDAERDYTPFLNELHNDFSGNCVYCSHCQPCPVEIDIAAVNKYLDIARLDESTIPPSVLSHYGSLQHRGAECIACGNCEERCPFGVQIINNMAKAAELFGS